MWGPGRPSVLVAQQAERQLARAAAQEVWVVAAQQAKRQQVRAVAE
jgi:hypothetical protein